MFTWISDPQAWIALLTLTALEIVLGIDNIIFISILCGRLPAGQQPRVRRIGLLAAMGMRVMLLLSLSWLMGLTRPLFALLGHSFSGRDLILLTGGLFLLVKSTLEIHNKLEGHEERRSAGAAVSVGGVITQIMLLDIVFSLDSVITAIGMAQHMAVMIIAVIVSVGVMLWLADSIAGFVERHPTIKILALSFLLLIGVTLLVEGLGQHMNKAYIYFAMAFSFGVEMLNMRLRRASAYGPVALHQLYRK